MSLSFQGVWQSRGYGWILDIRIDGYTLYDSTNINCMEVESVSIKDFHNYYDRCKMLNEHQLSLYKSGDITRYTFDRLDFLPVVTKSSLDPVLNFEVLWNIFAENYAFFNLRKINWDNIYNRYRALVTDKTSDEELFDIFKRMLLPFKDTHVYLSTGQQNVLIDTIPELRKRFKNSFRLPTTRVSHRSTVDGVFLFIENELLKGFNHSPLKSACNNIVSWCVLNENIGYLNILRLFGFADTKEAINSDDLPYDGKEAGRFLKDDMTALNTAFENIIDDFQYMEAIIIDIRINGGGFDKAGLGIANRFADKSRVAYRKKAVDGDGYTESQSFHISPEGNFKFTGQVYLLISPLTLSAGEILTLCLRALPKVKTVGNNTLGILSDNLIKQLPNGWTVSLSNEIYEAHDGNIYENSGIPPDIVYPEFEEENLLKKMKQELNFALQLAQNSIKNDNEWLIKN